MTSIASSSCLFCDNPLDGSDEHIIPESVNGRLHTKNLICEACNHKFGSKLDPIVKETLHFLLFALGIGNVKKMKVTDQDGKAYTIDQAGKMKEVAPEVKLIKLDDGRVGINVNGEKNTAIQAFAKKAARTFGRNALKILEDKGLKFEEKTNFLAEVKGEAAIEITPKLKLALNKILIEFYAHCGLPIEPIKERRNQIYNLDENGDDIVICNFDLDVRVPKEGMVSHLIVIRSDKERKQLYGYVEILNVICGYTVFEDSYTGPEVDIVYHQNAITGEKLNSAIEINTAAISPDNPNFDVLANNTLKNARSFEQLSNFQGMLDELKLNLDEEMKAGKISEGEREKLFIENAAQIAAQMMVFGNPDDVADFSDEEEKMVNYIHSVIIESGKDKFEFFYHQLVGREFPSEDDGQTYIMKNFIYKKHVPKKGENRLKAFCYFKAKESNNEKYFPVKEIFDALRLPPPPLDSNWL